jgi:hypothetical protein
MNGCSKDDRGSQNQALVQHDSKGLEAACQ